MIDKIMGGYFMLARQVFQSKIWVDKPATWKIIWLYILGNVNHKENKQFKRGEGFFNFSEEIRSKNMGADITSDMVKKCLGFLRQEAMISTIKSTRGIKIKVLNFVKYQDPINYTNTNTSTTKAQQKHNRSTTINNNDKNGKNEKNTTSAKSRRERIIFKKEDYNEIISLYEGLKGIELSGREYLPIQQTIKSMFLDGRQKKDIIACMQFFANNNREIWQNWTIQTVRKQLPYFIKGKL